MVSATPTRPASLETRENAACPYWGRKVPWVLVEQTFTHRSRFAAAPLIPNYPIPSAQNRGFCRLECMFLQVPVLEQDPSSLRFLWREDPAKNVEVYQYTRHIFPAKDSPTCGKYALQRTAEDNRAAYSNAAQAVHEIFYMDDDLNSMETRDEALNHCQDLVRLLRLGGFKLTKFISNDPELLRQLSNQKFKTTLQF